MAAEFTYYFQQIMGFRGTHIEALFRNSKTGQFDPILLSSISLRNQFTVVLDILTKTNFNNAFLHFNVNSTGLTLLDLKSLSDICNKFGIQTNKVVIEFVEDQKVAMNLVQIAKDLGFQCALDDLGVGFSIASLDPHTHYDIVKFDKIWLSTDLHIKALPGTLMFLKKNFPKTKFVIEGVETDYHLAIAKACKFKMFQGFLFDVPKKYIVFKEKKVVA